jgi:hypothetical protein
MSPVLPWLLALLVVGVFILVAVARLHFQRRAAYYRALAARRPDVVRGHEPVLLAEPPGADLAETFRRDFLIRVENFLDPAALERLHQEGVANLPRLKRSYIPTHKKGGTVSYRLLHDFAPGCLAFYHSPAVHAWVARVVGETVRPAADHDQSACSLLYYTETGDHIQWHYDHNFYRGRQFTVLLFLENHGGDGGTSASRLQRKDAMGKAIDIDTGENTLVLFEGARVVHRVSPAGPGDRRIVLSMTFNTDPRIRWSGEVKRRVKDTAFYGVRVLWG